MKKSMGCLLVLASLGLGGGYAYAAEPGQGAPGASYDQAWDETISLEYLDQILDGVPDYDWSGLRSKIGKHQEIHLAEFYQTLEDPMDLTMFTYALIEDPKGRNILRKLQPNILMKKLQWQLNNEPQNPNDNFRIQRAQVFSALALYSGLQAFEDFKNFNFNKDEIRAAEEMIDDGVVRMRRKEGDFTFAKYDPNALRYRYPSMAINIWSQNGRYPQDLWNTALRIGENKEYLEILNTPPTLTKALASGPIGAMINMRAISAVIGMKSEGFRLRLDQEIKFGQLFMAQASSPEGNQLWKHVGAKDSLKVIEYLTVVAQRSFKGKHMNFGGAIAQTLLQVGVTDKKELEKYVKPTTAKLISKTIEETPMNDPKEGLSAIIFLSSASPEAKKKMFDKVKKAEVSETGKSALKSIMKDTPETNKVFEALRKLPEYGENKKLEDVVLENNKLGDKPKKHGGSMGADHVMELKEVDKKMILPVPPEKGSKFQEVDRKNKPN